MMATIQPEGEKVKKALKWISQERQEDEGHNLAGLINKASMRFNLSPKEEAFLNHFFREEAP
jgi:hypothetical protein